MILRSMDGSDLEFEMPHGMRPRMGINPGNIDIVLSNPQHVFNVNFSNPVDVTALANTLK